MYIPRHFAVPLSIVHELVPQIDHGNLVTAHETGPVSTLLPFHHESGEGFGSLITHMSRVNPQWQTPYLGEALLIADFADHYINPLWSPGFADDPKVPTWNYLTLHIYGSLSIFDDDQTKLAAVAALCASQDFDLDLVPSEVVVRQLRAIVGVKFVISRVAAKAKLGQNLRPEEIAGHIAGLAESGTGGALATANAMSELAVPYANRRWLDIAALRERQGH